MQLLKLTMASDEVINYNPLSTCKDIKQLQVTDAVVPTYAISEHFKWQSYYEMYNY